MSRADLLALSPESLAALANLGLVKRAQRELAAGEGPELDEDAGGVVTGRFKDGTVTRLAPSQALREAPCSCGALTVCRHRVAVALAYPAWHASRAVAPAASVEPWSPSCFTDDALRAALGEQALDRARALVGAGVVVELDPGAIPGARLPTCAVRFHVPRDLAYARCDCARTTGCEHIAVAAWAFREAERARHVGGAPLGVPRSGPGGPAPPAPAPPSPLARSRAPDPPRTVELHGGGERASLDLEPMAEAVALAATVVAEGIAGLGPSSAPRFAHVRDRLGKAGLVWPATLVDDLELALEAYRAQSARYSAAGAALLLTGIAARARALGRGGELPARYLLGADEASETPLDHVRLVSLGARVQADGRARDAEVFVADPDSGMVLVLARRWTFDEPEEPEDGPALERRVLAGRITLGALARGQLVSRAVRRRANRSITLGSPRGGASSVTPQSGAWELFPPSILAADFEGLQRSLDAAPPRVLRPRVLAEAMRVVAVAEVGLVGYHPGEQELVAEIADAQGNTMRVVRRYRRAAPHALGAIAGALAGPAALRFVAGDVRYGPFGLEIDPVGLVTDRMIVPDLEPSAGPGAAMEGGDERHESPLLEALGLASSRLEEAAHLGLVRVRAEWIGRTREAAGRLDEVGLAAPARRLLMLAERVQAIGDEVAAERVRAAADAWMSAAILVELTREAAVRG